METKEIENQFIAAVREKFEGECQWAVCEGPSTFRPCGQWAEGKDEFDRFICSYHKRMMDGKA